MRTRLIRMAAAAIGVLGTASLVLQAVRAWPLGAWELKFYCLEAVVLICFLQFGFGDRFRPRIPGADEE
jgi:hypothetical protein